MSEEAKFSGQKLVGKSYMPPDQWAKVTGTAKFAEDFRAEGMLYCKLLLSPMPHARVKKINAAAPCFITLRRCLKSRLLTLKRNRNC